LPLPVEQFVSRWGDTVPTQRPQLAFQVQSGGRPAFRLVAVQPEWQIVAWHEDVAVTRRRLDWSLTAELKPTATSLFTFSVLLDRRLTIDEVSVKENEVEQLLRWSKTPMIGSSQARVTVFLNREAVSTSQLKIRGNLRMRPASPVVLPSVRFEAAQGGAGALTLWHEAGHRLSVEGRQQPLEGDAQVPMGATDAVPLRFFGRFRIPEGDSGLTVRLDPASGACRAQALWLLEPGEPNWRIRGWLELTPEEGTREVRITVPAWLSSAKRSVGDDGPAPLQRTEQGEDVLQLACDEKRTPRVLAWDADVPPPTEPVWQFALPRVEQATGVDAYAVLVPSSDWELSESLLAPTATVSEGIRQQLSRWSTAEPEMMSRLVSESLTVHRLDGRSPEQRAVDLAVHALLRTPDGSWLAETALYPTPTAGDLKLELPAGVELISLLGDGRPLLAEGGRIIDAGRRSVVTLRWKLPASSVARLIERVRVPLPRCVQDRPPKAVVAIRGADESVWIVPRNLQPQSTWELAVLRLDLLLKRFQQQRNGDATLSRAIWKEYRTAASALPKHTAVWRWSEEDRLRWQALTEAVGKIEEPERSETGSAEGAVSTPAADDDRLVAGQLSAGAAEVRCWTIRRDVVNWTSAGLLLVVGWWVLPGVVGLQYARWLQGRRYAGWFLFGLAWWLFWSPGIAGIAVMAWSVAGGLARRRARVVVNQ
jgi:hypothetical protein